MLALVGLADWGAVRLGKYSKGMLQRVGLAQALIHSPQLLILDEPTDGVDPVGRRQIREILHALEEKGVDDLYQLAPAAGSGVVLRRSRDSAEGQRRADRPDSRSHQGQRLSSDGGRDAR